MGTDVYANGREIACKASSGKTIADFPDTCLSPPSPPAGPVPVPYPNTASASDTTNGSTTVMICGLEVMLRDSSTFKTSTGNEAATRTLGMGVVTHTIQGEASFVSWSMDVQIEGQNVDRHLDMTVPNELSMPVDGPPKPHQSSAASGDASAAAQEQRCRQQRSAILSKYAKLGKELRKYDPVADAKGGFPMKWGTTKPGGHYKEITDLQRGLKNDLTRFNAECRDTDVKIDRNVDRMANQPIPRPPGL